jgi:antitoxin component YwqK of YwqJK toxin-antitoxin module
VNEDPEGYWEVDINGQDYAPYRGYYPNGVLREKGTCFVEKIGDEIVPDRTDVLDAEYFDPNGRVISRVKNGTGKQILYSTNGSPFWELHLEDRKRTLLRMWQHPNGQLSYESKGQDHGEFAAYYSDGQVMYHGEFENGKRTTKTDYTPNGQVKTLTTYDEHGTVESVTEYDQHGNVIGKTE